MLATYRILVALLAALVAATAFAQAKPQAGTKTEVKAQTESKEKPEEDEADKLITNRRMRADMGSVSNWSVRTFWSYNGGSLEKPAAPERPNIDAGADALTLANGSGSVGVRYRMTKLDSVNVSVGLNMTAPFHTTIKTDNARLKQNFNNNRQKMTVNDPTITYTHVDSVFGFQSNTSVSASLITNAQLEEAGYNTYGALSQTLMKDFGGGFTAGTSVTFSGYTFNSNYDDTRKAGGRLQDRAFGVYPQLEYVINDVFLLRTVFRTWVYERLEPTDSWTYRKRKVTQSTGVGISLSRDIFLYPNIQFVPSDMRADRTNVGITANINLF